MIHLNSKAYQCECGRSFGTKEHRDRHYITKHTFLKPFPCERGCDKSFSSHNSRAYHYTSYHDRQSFECHVCHRKYTTKANLTLHFNRTHADTVSYIEQLQEKSQAIAKLESELEGLKHEMTSLVDLLDPKMDEVGHPMSIW